MLATAGDRFIARSCQTPDEAVAAVRAAPNAIVLADLETLGGAGAIGRFDGGALIATSASGSLNTAIAALKSGAHDFLPKPIGAKALIERLEATIADWGAARDRRDAAQGAARSRRADGSGRRGFRRFRRPLAGDDGGLRTDPPHGASRAPVFVTGESGTGKELCAEAIHANAFADAPSRPFVAINCSAIPRELMESEIFGHVRGAFTGAAADRTGAAETRRRRHAVPRRNLRDGPGAAGEAAALRADRARSAGSAETR